MYCYNCGAKIEATDLFCAHCGARLSEEPQPVKTAAYFDIYVSEPKGQDEVEEGYILTDTSRLATRLGVNDSTVKGILDEFVSIRKAEGVAYSVIDLAYSGSQHDYSWHTCRQLLRQRYEQDKLRGLAPIYLYIIGGDDIVPMPTLPLKICSDDTVDTDLPYAYLASTHVVDELLDLSIFSQRASLFCGRLPIAANATLADFIGMLNNTLSVGYDGLPRQQMHVQSDPNWKVITMRAAQDTGASLQQSQADSPYYYGPVMLTPIFEPTKAPFANAFPYHDADVFYYNLHGTNTPGTDNFVGQPESSKDFHCALRPQDMAMVANLNVVMTEACYGGWFKTSVANPQTKKKEETVLLASLHAHTVSYVGSSRVAYGYNNAQVNLGLQSADALAHQYLGYLYQGLPATLALHHAKIDLLEAGGNLETARITVLEFNLYGDPSLSIVSDNLQDAEADGKRSSERKATDTATTFTVHYDSTAGSGLLATVRHLVDSNLRAIDQTLQQYLYDTWGLDRCSLKRVVGAKSRKSNEETAYFYKGERGSVVVTLDERSQQVKSCLFER